MEHTSRRSAGAVPGRPGSTPADAQAGALAVGVHADLSALPERFEALFQAAGQHSLFFSLQWYRNFVASVLAPDEHLRVYAADGVPAAARGVLLMSYRDAGAGQSGARVLSGLTNYYSSLFGPATDPDAADAQPTLDALAAAIARDAPAWDVVDLHPLAADQPVFAQLEQAFGKAGYVVRRYFCFGNWTLQVRGRSYAEYIETLPSPLKNTLRRKRRQLDKTPGARIVLVHDASRLDEALRAYEQCYAASWKIPEPYPEFIRGLCRTCAEAGWLRMGVLYVGEQPAAAQIWIVSGGIASIYKLAYDERHARLSAGSILSAHLMQYVIDVDKVREVDYLTGDDAYKKDWMSDRRERWGLVAFNPRTPYGALAFARHLGGRALRPALGPLRRLGAAVLRSAAGRAARVLRSAAAAFVRAISELGWLNGSGYALDRLLAAVTRERVRLRKYYFVAQPVPAKRWLAPRRGAAIEVRRVMASDPVIAQFPRPDTVIDYRFAQDAICLAGSKAGHCVGFLWFTLGPYQEDEVRCRYMPEPQGKAAWDFDVYLHPDDRNGIAFLKLWDEANAFFAARGIGWSLSRISAFNRNSMLSHARMGAQRIGVVTFLSLGPWQLSLANVRPWFHLSKRPDSYPLYALGPGPGRGGGDAAAR